MMKRIVTMIVVFCFLMLSACTFAMAENLNESWTPDVVLGDSNAKTGTTTPVYLSGAAKTGTTTPVYLSSTPELGDSEIQNGWLLAISAMTLVGAVVAHKKVRQNAR